MKNQDLPALYRSADQLSRDAQAHFFRALFVHLFVLVIAALLSLVDVSHWSIALLQLLALLSALFCSIYLFSVRPDKLWYAGRAVAESVKTIAWRYACCAEPFQMGVTSARDDFHRTIEVIGQQNRDVLQALTDYLGETQVTDAMEAMRILPINERRDFYLEGRIVEQLDWYSGKANLNRKLSKIFFWALIFVNAMGVVFAAVRVALPEQSFWPTDLFIAIAASLLSWMQAKRFAELASSYALAANEIGLIKDKALFPATDAAFSIFVGDAENAFSREHTLWVARKDV